MDYNMNQNIIKHFDDYAKSHRWQDYYDNGLNSDNCNFYLRFEAFKKIVHDMFPKKVIDLGCGSGDFLSFFIYSDTYYHGVDFSHEMVRAVKKKIEDLPESIRHRFSCEQEDFITMEISEKYDFLLASGFLEYFDDLKMVAKKMHDLTETNGYVLVQIPNVEYYRWRNKKQIVNPDKQFTHNRITKDECNHLFSEEGFRLINGYFVNHTYFPYLRMFPYVYVFLNRILSTITPEVYSRLYASMYLGVYQK